MITVVCCLWDDRRQGIVLPSQITTRYDAGWVYKLRDGVARHYPYPHRFVCLTDHPERLTGVEALQYWEDYREMGGCFSRLKLFSPEMKELLGERFVSMDVDCVITGPLQPLFERSEDFVMHRYCSQRIDQRYNGSMMLMTAGARRQVWDRFVANPSAVPGIISRNKRMVVGTDQAWVRLTLGTGEALFTEQDGCYEASRLRALPPATSRVVRWERGVPINATAARQMPSYHARVACLRRANGGVSIPGKLPDNARVVFFSGPTSPQTEYSKHQWIREHWV